MKSLTDQQFVRYSRQVMMERWGEAGQLSLADAKVVIIGCGGLGNTVASLLAGAGVGHITLMDDDNVELSNLPRQLAFDMGDIANAKVLALANRLREQNEDIAVTPLLQRFEYGCASQCLSGATLVLDCSDNFATRYAINHACLDLMLPLLSASVIGWHGQMLLVINDGEHNCHGCYQCLFNHTDDRALNCNTAGVSGAAVAIVASYQANEAIRFMLGQKSTLSSSLMLIDTISLDNKKLKRTSDPKCAVCANKGKH